MWEAKEAVRDLYAHADPDLAIDWVTQLGHDLQDADYPVEARSLGRTSSAGDTRLPPGTAPKSPTGRPRR
jgi:hypothetical protein